MPARAFLVPAVLVVILFAARFPAAGGEDTKAPPEKVRHALVQKKVGFYSVFLPPEVDPGAVRDGGLPICVLLPDMAAGDQEVEALANLLGRRGVIYVAPPAAHEISVRRVVGGPPNRIASIWPRFPEEWGDWGSDRFPTAEVEALRIERLATDWIADCVADVRRRYSAADRRVDVVGHGSGATLAHLLAVHRPEMVDAYFAYAGSYRRGLDDDLAALTLKKHGVRPILVHMQGDPRAEARETQALSAYLAAREVEHDLMVFPGSSHDFTSKVTRAAREFVADRCRGEELPPLVGEVVVTAVLEGSPGAEAGLRTGDVLLSYNGRTVKTRDDFSEAQSTLVWGQEEAVITWRRGELELDATVAVGRLGLTLEDR